MAVPISKVGKESKTCHTFSTGNVYVVDYILLVEDLLSEIREFSEFYIFQQDDAPAHRARETVALLTTETPDFINPTL